MNDVVPDQPAPDRVGDRLRREREAKGLTLAEVAQRTRVPLRHLEAIEATDFAALPSPTYAVGFARAYARALGMDEVAVARDVRTDLRNVERAPQYAPYETADPARVPPRGIAIVGLGLALAVVILVGLWYGTDIFRGGSTGSADIASAPPPITVTPTAAPSPVAPNSGRGQVTLTAGASEVWLRVYDADDKTLYLGTLAPGAKFDVPPDANRPMINVGRPDQLQVSVDGRTAPPLGDGSRAIMNVPVDAASIAARLTGQPVATPGTAASVLPAAAPSTTAPTASPPTASSSTATPTAASRSSRAAATRPRPRPSPKRRLTETQRANLESAANLSAPSKRQ